MNNNLDLSEYGIFDGERIIPMNRKEKRKYIKDQKHNKNATICPKCHYKTNKITDDNGNLVCELCGKIIEE